MQIRTITATDSPQWHRLWAQYLAFYNVDLAPEVTASTLARALSPDSPMNIRIAHEGDTLLAFAVHMNHPSTWVMGDDCYLEDLFVAPDARGQGVGRALITDLTAIAKSKGWHRLYWHTNEDNATARKLYDSITPSDGHIRYRLKL